MANGDDDPIGAGGPGGPGGPPEGGPMGPGPGGGAAPTGPPGGGPGGGPGPVLAALARRGMQPQVSAPGMGNMAHGLMQIKTAVDMIQAALPSLPAGSAQHKDALKAITSLSRHLPQGAPTAGVQQTQIGDLLRSTVRNALMQRLMSQRGGQGGGAAGQPGQGAGGMPPPPAPSTPLPGT